MPSSTGRPSRVSATKAGKPEPDKASLWAVYYKTQNHQEGWLVAKAKTAGQACMEIMRALSSKDDTDYLSLKIEMTAHRCGQWL